MTEYVIEIYPMKNTADGATMTEGREEPDFYDVLVREINAEGDPDEVEDESEDHLTYDLAWAAAEAFQKKYPGSEIEEIDV